MTARQVAWVLAGIGAAAFATMAAGAWAVGSSAEDVVASYTLTNTAFGLGFGGCGLVIALHRPRNAVGWLFLAGALAHLITAAAAPWSWYGVEHGWPIPVLRLIATIMAIAWPFGIGLAFPLALLLFPSGRIPPPPRRWVAYVFALSGLLFVLWMGTSPEEFAPGVSSYLALPFYAELEPLWSVVTVLGLPQALVIVVTMVVSYRRGDETVRRQLLWLLLAVIIAFAVNVQRFAVGDGPILLLLVFELVPVAVAVAIVRHQLFDIRLVVSRTITYLLVTGLVVGAYVGIVALLDATARQLGLGGSILAAVAVAIAFNPLRLRLQGLVDRLFYGDRHDPVRAAARVGQRLVESDGTDRALVLDAVREALRLPYAALTTTDSDIVASGEPTAHRHVVELRLGGSTLGELVVGLRAGERRLAAADAGVLELMAVPLAMAVRSAALADEVADSRGRIVAGQEEERRRLRRDLHDGLGPVLTGIAYKIDAARNLLAGEPERVDELLRELRATTGGAIEDIRRVVYGLRPPSLDELGLAGALRHQAARLSTGSTGRPLTVTVTAPSELPELPAAVEVAAFRIAVEGITNVARHSGASRAEVRLAVDGSELQVTVADDAAGQAAWRPGVGLTVMAERAAEVGGSCSAGPTGSGGLVRAVLPLPHGVDQGQKVVDEDQPTTFCP